jgi:putative hemolysin
MTLEITLVVVLALLNGFFALSEMALMTSRKSRLKHMAITSRRASVAFHLSQTPEHLLATVQVFITLIGIGTGAALGEKLGVQIAALFENSHVQWIGPYARVVGIVISVAGITFVNMLLGELLPKRVALLNPERWAVLVAIPMRVLVWVAMPFAFVLIAITRGILRLFRQTRMSGERVSEEEIRLLVSESAEQGVIDPDERNMVNRVLRLGDRTVDSMMTPRPRIAWLDASESLDENLSVMRNTPYSRYPVYRDSDKDILGILTLKRLPELIGNARVDLFTNLAKPLYVPGTARALDLLEEFRDAETRLALVVDEYGDIEGLVTLNDLLSAVVGKSATPTQPTRDAPVVRRDDGTWLVDGSVSTDDLRELLGTTELPHQEDHDFHTAAGMVVAHFGRIPQASEHFEWRGIRFEVVDLDGARIDKLLIKRNPDVEMAVDETG